MKAEPLDPRSTGRRRGRKVLEYIGRPFWCGSTEDGGVKVENVTLPDGRTVQVGCGRSPTEEDAPGGHYPAMGQLQVNHINKNVLDNDPVNLEWMCASCHKYKDSQTEKGVSVKGEDEYGYGPPVGVSTGCDHCHHWPEDDCHWCGMMGDE